MIQVFCSIILIIKNLKFIFIFLEPSIGLKIEKGNTSSANDDTLNSTYSASNSLHLKSGDFVVNSSVEDTLNNLKMSIRRKRLCSTSSALSNTEVSSEDIQRSKKKKKRKSRNNIYNRSFLFYDLIL